MAFVELRQTIIGILADYFLTGDGLCENLFGTFAVVRLHEAEQQRQFLSLRSKVIAGESTPRKSR